MKTKKMLIYGVAMLVALFFVTNCASADSYSSSTATATATATGGSATIKLDKKHKDSDHHDDSGSHKNNNSSKKHVAVVKRLPATGSNGIVLAMLAVISLAIAVVVGKKKLSVSSVK